jgi:hypothetical protein
MTTNHFSQFDEIANTGTFWTAPILPINDQIKAKQDLDAIGNSGVTLVIGSLQPTRAYYLSPKMAETGRTSN